MENPSETREDLAREIAARLEVRRKFYIGAFAVVSIVVLLTLVIGWWLAGGMPPYMVVGAGAPILGTGVVLWWLYVLRRAAPYEEVGRRYLKER